MFGYRASSMDEAASQYANQELDKKEGTDAVLVLCLMWLALDAHIPITSLIQAFF